MPQGDGVARQVDGGEGAVDEVHVGQAHARGLHFDQYLSLARVLLTGEPLEETLAPRLVDLVLEGSRP